MSVYNALFKGRLGSGFEADQSKKAQTIRFHYDKNGNLQQEGTLHLDKDVWYEAKVLFVNKSGTPINHQYVEDEHARALHQFFYRTFAWEEKKNDPNTMTQLRIGDQNPFDYRYGDTYASGTNKGKLIDPPVGFLGYMKVNSQKIAALGERKFVLNAILVHVLGSSKLNPRNGKPFPFDQPGDEIMGVTDIDHRFPVVIND